MNSTMKSLTEASLFYFLGFLTGIGLMNYGDSGLDGQVVLFWTTTSNIKILVYIFHSNGSNLQVAEMLACVLLIGMLLVALKTFTTMILNQRRPHHVAVQETLQTSQPHGQLVCG